MGQAGKILAALAATATALGAPVVGSALAQLKPAEQPARTTPAAAVTAAPSPKAPAPKAPAPTGTGASGQPLPRFVSLKSDRVNMRTGPGTEYPMQWVYRRAGLPMEVIRELEAWRQVRDSDGATGWVLASLLSSRRTALVEPWSLKPGAPDAPQVALKDGDRDGAQNVAMVEAGVIANVKSCDGRWCAVTVGDFRGYLQQTRLWGVYKGETVR